MAIIDWTSNFPSSLDSTSNMQNLTNNVDDTRVSQIHAIRDAIIQIETEIGTNSPASGTIQNRLNILSTLSSSFVDIRKYGALGNGNASAVNALSASILDAQTNTGGIVLIPSGNFRLDSSVHVSGGVDLLFVPGGQLSMDSGSVLTIDGYIHAGNRKIFELSGSLISGTIKNDQILPEWFGVLGDGTQDDTYPFQRCLDYCSVNGKTAFISDGLTIRTTKNLYIWGSGSLIGANASRCVVELDANPNDTVGKDYERYWFNCGIVGEPDLPGSSSAATDIWSGELRNFKFNITSNVNTTGGIGMVQYHSCYGATTDNVEFNCVARGGQNTTTTIVSQLDGNWGETAKLFKRYCVLNNTRHILVGKGDEGDGTGGINLVGPEGWRITNNYVNYCSDDALVVIGNNAINNYIAGNWVAATHGRIGSLGGRDNIFIGNFAKKVTGTDNHSGSGDIFSFEPVSLSSYAPRNIVCIGNRTYYPENGAPSSSPSHIKAAGVRGAVIANNILESDATGSSNMYGVFVGAYNMQTGFGGSWTDPDGYDWDDIARPRDIKVIGNLCRGNGNIPTIEESATGSADIIGPVLYEGNTAPSYNIFGAASTFSSTNVRPSGSTTAEVMTNLSGLSIVDTIPIHFRFLDVRAGKVIDGATFSGKNKYFPRMDGLFAFATIESEEVIDNGDIRMDVFVNSSQVMSKAVAISDGNQHGVVDFRLETDRTFDSNDTIKVQLSGGESLTGIYDCEVILHIMRVRGLMEP